MTESGETDLTKLLKSLRAKLNPGDYVFCKWPAHKDIPHRDIVMFFREEEAITVIVRKVLADQWQLSYSSVFAWITLTIHSSLNAVGLTAAFSKALSEKGISCNVVAALYHDHIFVGKSDADDALKILAQLSEQS